MRDERIFLERGGSYADYHSIYRTSTSTRGSTSGVAIDAAPALAPRFEVALSVPLTARQRVRQNSVNLPPISLEKINEDTQRPLSADSPSKSPTKQLK